MSKQTVKYEVTPVRHSEMVAFVERLGLAPERVMELTITPDAIITTIKHDIDTTEYVS